MKTSKNDQGQLYQYSSDLKNLCIILHQIQKDFQILISEKNPAKLEQFIVSVFLFFPEVSRKIYTWRNELKTYPSSRRYGDKLTPDSAQIAIENFCHDFFQNLKGQLLPDSFDQILIKFLKDYGVSYKPALILDILNCGIQLKSGQSIYFLLCNDMHHEIAAFNFVNEVLLPNPIFLQEFADAKELNTQKSILETLHESQKYALIGFLEGFKKNPTLCQGLIVQAQEAIERLAQEQAQKEENDRIIAQQKKEADSRELEAQLALYQERQAILQSTQYCFFKKPEITTELKNFIAARKRATQPNTILSSQFGLDAKDLDLVCMISLDFPVIPVMLQGQLYDYNYLEPLINKDGIIVVPDTRTKVSIDNIQPDFNSQRRMDRLLKDNLEGKNVSYSKPN